MKMKKFMNAPETVTDEELVGLGLAYPDILNVDGHLVISKDLANADRVTIVTYGGSGAQAGFVGKGMLDIQAVGDIFAAPNGQLVFDAMKMADKGHGVLLLALRSGLMGREQVTFRGRAIHYRRVLNAMTLALVVLGVFVFSSMVVSTVEDLPYLDSAFEVASAMGTVGLTTGTTPTLTPFSQGLLILLMYMGRVGILSFSIAFITGNRHPAKIKYPEMNVMIG